MGRVEIKVHSSDLIGTCDRAGECSTLTDYINELEDLGLEESAQETVFEHRQAACAEAGRCTLYYGLKEQENA